MLPTRLLLQRRSTFLQPDIEEGGSFLACLRPRGVLRDAAIVHKVDTDTSIQT